MIEIPNYTIEKELGRGGMATVYLAVQDILSRHVALKVMLPEMARDENFRKSFLSEGRIIANLEHTNIVRIHDVGVIDDSILYMAMEYLKGRTLKEKLQQGKLSYAKSLKILEQAASGLSYAHSKGYIHRDIKPGNILFRENGTAVITDFGIAKLQDTSGELTRMGYTMGTVQYMSPEQAITTDLDSRSDIYSLGLVFYEMLTGKKAFKAESTIQAIHQHTTVPPPELPDEYAFLQSTIDKVLAKDPDDRYQKIEDFVRAVNSAADVDKTIIHKLPPRTETDETLVISQTLVQEKINKPKRKKGLIAGIAGSLLLGAIAFGVSKYPEYIEENKSTTKTSQQLDTANVNNQKLKLEKEQLQAEREAKQREQDQQEAINKQNKLIAAKKEQERLKAEQAYREKLEAEEQKRVLTEQKEKERQITEQAKKVKLEQEQKLAEQIEKARLVAKQAEKAKLAAVQKQQQALEAEQKEKERLIAEQKEKDLLVDKKAEEQAEENKKKEIEDTEEKERERLLAKEKVEKKALEKTAERKRRDKELKRKKEKEALVRAEKRRAEKKKKDLARKKANQEKKRRLALLEKKRKEAARRKRLANAKGQIRVSATLNGRPLNTAFVVTKNGKKVQTISGRASANFVLPAGRYVITTRYGNKTSRANVALDANDVITQRFAFKGRAPARRAVKQPQKPAPQKDDEWTHTHVPGSAPVQKRSLTKEDQKYEIEQYFPRK